jgi:hypothetical protein
MPKKSGDKIMRKGKKRTPSILLVLLLSIPLVIFGSHTLGSQGEERTEISDVTIASQNDTPKPIKISSSGARSATPLVVAHSSGVAAVIWIEGTGGKRRVFFNSNKGGSWGNPVNTSSDIKIGGSGPWPDFALDKAGRLHYVVTAVSDYPNYEVFYKQYSDNTWQRSQNISNTAEPDSGGSACPTIATSPTNNNCYAVWYDDIHTPDRWRLYFTYKSGGSWSSSRALPVDNGTYTPEIDVDGNGHAHLIWIKRRRTSSVVWYSSNPNPTNINSWTEAISISGESNEDWCEPDIAVDNQGNVHITWIQNKSGNREIYVRSRINGSWGDRQNVSRTSGKSYLPRIAVNRTNGNAFVVWQERKNGKWQIYFNHSQGGKWSTPIALTNNSSDSIEPDIFVDNSNEVHVVYSDNASGGYNIWYISTSDVGGIITGVYPPLNVRLNSVRDDNSKRNIVRWKKNSANDNTNVKGYKIYRKKAPQGVSSYSLHKTVDKSVFKFEDTGLSLDTKYSYVLTTEDNEGEESDYSNETSEPLVFPPVEITTASELDSTKTKKNNIISWKNNPRNNGTTVKEYRIYRRVGTSGSFNQIKIVQGGVRSYQDKNLLTQKKYVYRLTAVDKNNRECEQSLSSYEDYVFCPINVSLKTAVNEGMFFSEKINRLRWKHNPLNDPIDVAKYIVYRKEVGQPNNTYMPLFTADALTFEFLDRNLPLDKKFSYTLTSVAGNGAQSDFSPSRKEQ